MMACDGCSSGLQARFYKKVDILRRIPPHMLVAASAWLSRLVTAAVGLLSIRVLIQGLGTDQYAVYAVLGGLQGWYLLADLGIGTSLQNHISERRAMERPYEDFIAIAGVIAIILMVLSIVLLYFASPFLAPLVMKGASYLSEAEKAQHFFVVGLISVATCIGGISYRIWYAEQKGYLANIIPSVASLLSFAAVVAVSQSSLAHKLYWSLIAAFGPAGALPAAIFLKRIAGNVLQVRSVKLDILWPLVKRGLKFWLVAIMAAGVLQVDYLIMSRFLTANEIVVYNLTAKMFALVYFVYTAILSAVWPVCAEAIAQNAWQQVTRLLSRYIIIGTVIIVAFTLILYFYLQPIVNILSPKEIVTVPVQFVIFFGLYQLVRVFTDTYGMALQSMSYIRPFLIYMPIQVLINVFLQWVLVAKYGVYGVIAGLSLSFLLTATWVIPFSFYKKRNDKLLNAT